MDKGEDGEDVDDDQKLIHEGLHCDEQQQLPMRLNDGETRGESDLIAAKGQMSHLILN